MLALKFIVAAGQLYSYVHIYIIFIVCNFNKIIATSGTH